MSKVICEICGTSYPDTARQCPICGCSRDMGGHLTADLYDQEEEYTEARSSHVKGGRFSAANVKNRNAHMVYDEYDAPEDDYPEEEVQPRKKGKGLAVALVILILMMLSVTAFLFVKVFLPNMEMEQPEQTQPQTTAQTQPETTEETTVETTIPTVPCTSLELESDFVVRLEKEGQYYLVHTTALPEDTTDEIIYTSADETIVTVDSDGRLTAVGEGTAVITVVCGDKTVECMVVCDFSESTEATQDSEPETTQPESEPETTEAPTQEETKAQSNASIAFAKTDLTFNSIGVTYKLKYTPEDIPAESITWTSGNNNIASIQDGVVYVKSWGITSVFAEYNGVKVECVIRALEELQVGTDA